MYAHGTTSPAPPSNSGEFSAAEVARDHPHASRVGRLCTQPRINTNTFPPRSWSVHGQPVCTNNDIEGWHNSLDRRAGGRVIYLSTYWFSCSMESPLCALSKFNSSMPENFKGSRIKNIVHFKQESLATGKTMLPVKFQVGDFLKHALT